MKTGPLKEQPVLLGAEPSLGPLVFSFYHIGSRNRTQAGWLSSKHLYWLSQLTGPLLMFMKWTGSFLRNTGSFLRAYLSPRCFPECM